MIFSIGCSLATFKPLTFKPGLNVLLAERHVKSTDQETRNGAGKSSVIEIVHFLLGSAVTEGSLFKSKALARETFWGTFRFGSIDVHVSRSVADSKRVKVDFGKGDFARPDVTRELDGEYAQIDDWTRWLGHVVFDLPARPKTKPFDVKNAPTFRQCFPYFARRRQDGGFQRPEKFSTSQSTASAQINLSYLMGLDWTLALEFEEAREEKRQHDTFSRRLKAKQDENLNTASRLRAGVAVAENDVEKSRTSLDSFEVEARYEELSREAGAAKIRIEKINVESATLTSTISRIEASLEEERGVDGHDVARLYAAAGVQLPGSVVKTFEDVKAFHASVISNRRHHLREEHDTSVRRLASISAERAALSAKRAEILRQLRGKGAFSDLAVLTQSLAEKEQKLAKLRGQLEDALEVETKSDDLKVSKASLVSRLRTDLASRSASINTVVLAVDEARRALYANRYGLFEVEATTNGPDFRVHIDADRSAGIASMEVFCFDYALSKLVTTRFGGPGFLIHDSHLFDAVDSRQIATAIELASRLADESGGQYIVMQNTDEIDQLKWSEGFDIQSKIMPTRLKDTDDGGLFGFKFV